jgi:AraC-like DNA-binding protein
MQANAQSHFCRYFPIAERDREWGLSITTVGEFYFCPGKFLPPQDQPKHYGFDALAGRLLHEHQLVYVTSGQGWFKSKETGRVPISAGNLIILFPGIRHMYAPLVSTGWKEYWVGFNGDWPQRWLRLGFFDPKHPVIQTRREDQLLYLFNELIEVARSNPPAEQQIMAAITHRILAHIYSLKQSVTAHEDHGTLIIHTAISRLREAHATKPDLEKLASELKVSYRWFRSTFARHTGMSPYKYVLEMRLARARDLLIETSLSTKEIALLLGFEDAQYFCRLFHKKVGLSPGAWRHRAVRSQWKSNQK